MIKKRTNKLFCLSLFVLLAPIIVGCNKQTEKKETSYFTYEDISFTDSIGSKMNYEAHDYNGIKVNRTDEVLRDDFAFGVDASMTYVVERQGGVYYNQKGQEQDLYQILRKSGVNFVRFRVWVTPENKYGDTYGGGENDLEVDLAMAKRAKAANLNVLLDFHYSDFWADPESQHAPRTWGGVYDDNDTPNYIYNHTLEVLNRFKSEGVTVDAVQIGNETNNGLAGYSINWNNMNQSFDKMAKMFSKGISAAKKVFPKIKTIIHLANGGSVDIFRSYFSELDKRNVNYDIIGASYYPHLSGSLDELQNSLNTVSELTGKPVMVVETSWGFTNSYNEYTSNTYTPLDENVGGYLTSEQAQATCLRDICNVLSKVPEHRGLGLFYWEPAWLPVNGASWATAEGQSYKNVGNDSKADIYEDGLATWSNQGLFSYSGKALASLKAFSFMRNGFNESEEVAYKLHDDVIEVTINLADSSSSLPSTARVVTDYDAIRTLPCTWSEEAIETIKTKGQHDGLIGHVGEFTITCNAKCIQNFVVDPGFENQGTTDTVKDPWVVETSTPVGDPVIKIDRKKDIRSGKSDLNWYHSSSRFTFKVSQTISLPAGTYSLTTYVMGISQKVIKHNILKIFFEVVGGETYELNIASYDYLKGWSSGYQTCTLEDVTLSEAKIVKVGIIGDAEPMAWAHNDDWELVRVDE